EALRHGIDQGKTGEQEIAEAVARLAPEVATTLEERNLLSLRPAINATGGGLHTNLGRAPLSRAALAHAQHVGTVYSNREFNLEACERGKRDAHTQSILDQLFAPYTYPNEPVTTIVVNNCAAAVLLTLNTLAEGGEVIVSRGELVEIGGSFRVPEVMAKSGAV